MIPGIQPVIGMFKLIIIVMLPSIINGHLVNTRQSMCFFIRTPRAEKDNKMPSENNCRIFDKLEVVHNDDHILCCDVHQDDPNLKFRVNYSLTLFPILTIHY